MFSIQAACKLCRTERHGITIELYRAWHVPLVFITRVRTYKPLIYELLIWMP